MNFLEEKWINDGCHIDETPDYEMEDKERLKDALRALDRTLDNFKNRKRGTKHESRIKSDIYSKQGKQND